MRKNQSKIGSSQGILLRILHGIALGFCLIPAGVLADIAEGLWTGDVTIVKVNEAVSAVDADNNVVVEDPKIPTPTSDAAHLRLIMHVDAAGQVRLLKSVALIDKDADPAAVDEALVTDPALYANFPPIARRIASAAFEFGDPAGPGAVESVATAAATAAADTLNGGGSESTARDNALLAAEAAVAAVEAAGGKSPAFAEFVASSIFTGSPEISVEGAIEGALASIAEGESGNDVNNAARSQSLIALAAVTAAGERVSLNELPMTGSLAADQTLSGEIFLGKNHPTNPFRHRLHRLHGTGIEIRRQLTLTIGAPPNGDTFEKGGFGVDRLNGVFKEEIFGLHKPLGPLQDTGLKVEGVFSLYRISRVAELNQ